MKTIFCFLSEYSVDKSRPHFSKMWISGEIPTPWHSENSNIRKLGPGPLCRARKFLISTGYLFGTRLDASSLLAQLPRLNVDQRVFGDVEQGFRGRKRVEIFANFQRDPVEERVIGARRIGVCHVQNQLANWDPFRLLSDCDRAENSAVVLKKLAECNEESFVV